MWHVPPKSRVHSPSSGGRDAPGGAVMMWREHILVQNPNPTQCPLNYWDGRDGLEVPAGATGATSLSRLSLQFQFSCSIVSNSLQPGTCSNSRPLSRWCHPTISSFVIPFSSCFQSFPASGSFPMSQFFASGGQSIGASASVSVLTMNNRTDFL